MWSGSVKPGGRWHWVLTGLSILRRSSLSKCSRLAVPMNVVDREESVLCQAGTLSAAATLTSPLLPGFTWLMATLFETTL